MKSLTILTIFLALLGKAFAHDPATDMATAAKRFLLSLDDKAKKEAVFAWNDKERENWHFVPGNFIKPRDTKANRIPMLTHQLCGKTNVHTRARRIACNRDSGSVGITGSDSG